jgi:uncharacterized membrane protein
LNQKSRKQQKEKEDNTISAELIEIENSLNLDEDVFRGIPQDKKRKILEGFSLTLTEKSHSGPIPDPESLSQYNSIITNGADRIMKMAENQQIHRIDIEKKAIKSQTSQSNKGQWMGFIIAIICLIGGVFLSVNGYKDIGLTLLGTTVLGLASIFVLNKILKG